jgi:hypothetical protein
VTVPRQVARGAEDAAELEGAAAAELVSAGPAASTDQDIQVAVL